MPFHLSYTLYRIPVGAWPRCQRLVGVYELSSIKTDPDLLAAIRNAAGRKMNPDQVREQRISFVMSAIDESSDVTRADVGRMIDEREGEAA